MVLAMSKAVANGPQSLSVGQRYTRSHGSSSGCKCVPCCALRKASLSRCSGARYPILSILGNPAGWCFRVAAGWNFRRLRCAAFLGATGWAGSLALGSGNCLPTLDESPRRRKASAATGKSRYAATVLRCTAVQRVDVVFSPTRFAYWYANGEMGLLLANAERYSGTFAISTY
jgi:hypothetical protein